MRFRTDGDHPIEMDVQLNLLTPDSRLRLNDSMIQTDELHVRSELFEQFGYVRGGMN